MMTPNDIEILLHCHVSPSPHPRRGAAAVDEALEHFREAGMIEWRHDCFVTTPRGAAFVRLLCETPWPEMAWIDPRTSEVIGA